MASVMKNITVLKNSASLEEARGRVFEFFKMTCRFIPQIMDIYNLQDVVNPHHLRSTVVAEICKNSHVTNPKVRSTGRIDQVTRQPIKGRKFGGGVRFGEMERDSMLAHGAAYLLHDRLHTCSDHHIADVCSLCGSILTTTFIPPPKHADKKFGGLPPARAAKKVICHSCGTSKGMETVAMPYVFQYLATELAAMNIKVTLQLSNNVEAKNDTLAK